MKKNTVANNWENKEIYDQETKGLDIDLWRWEFLRHDPITVGIGIAKVRIKKLMLRMPQRLTCLILLILP